MSGGRPSRQDDNELRHGPHSVDNRGDIVTYTDCCQQLCIVATTLRRGRRGSFESLLTAAIPSLKAGEGEREGTTGAYRRVDIETIRNIESVKCEDKSNEKLGRY